MLVDDAYCLGGDQVRRVAILREPLTIARPLAALTVIVADVPSQRAVLVVKAAAEVAAVGPLRVELLLPELAGVRLEVPLAWSGEGLGPGFGLEKGWGQG